MNNDRGVGYITRILITGSKGQIGTELIDKLRMIYGRENVIGSDIKKKDDANENYIYLDILNKAQFSKVIVDYDIDWIIHNASILSATGERRPMLAKEVNARGFEIAIELAKKYDLRILSPSSIAAFGPSTPRNRTPDTTIMRPNTMYGITKVWIELLGEYYQEKWGVDFRSLRYPGIISYKALPGGGTTDYAVEIFYEALKNGSYDSFLRPDSKLPMMYMPDCVRGTIELLEADEDELLQRVYNLGAISFSPEELAQEITKHLPQFEITYNPDYRQEIADTWPNSLDDSNAREQWGWQHEFDLEKMVADMLDKLSGKLGIRYQSALAQ